MQLLELIQKTFVTLLYCYIVVSTINDSGVDNIMFSREDLTGTESEREESGAKITRNSNRRGQENRKRELQARRGQEKASGTVLNNAVN